MSTNYPTSIDTFTNPTEDDKEDIVSHAGQHANANDAIEAIETKLGTGEKFIAGAGDVSNVNGQTKIMSTDVSDARMGAVSQNKGVFLLASGGSDVAIFAYDYSNAVPLGLVINKFGGAVTFGAGATLTIPAGTTLTQEAWHEIGASGQPAFENSWVNYGSPFSTAAFMKDSMGFVHIKGLIKSGTIGGVVFTLPVGYRPAATDIFATDTASNAHARVQVQGDGAVLTISGSNGYYALSGLTFKAEQ